jgi:tight adherence protein B
MVVAAWCDALARSVRGGNTVRHAIATVAPPPSVLGTVEPIRHALERGAALTDALGSTLDKAPPHVDLVLVVLRACAEHGGAAGEPIDRCAAALRQRAALLAERQSQSAQARMSALVMTLLPVALLTVLLVSSEPIRRVVTTPFGAAIVALGGIVNAAGWWWMRRLITGGARWR